MKRELKADSGACSSGTTRESSADAAALSSGSVGSFNLVPDLSSSSTHWRICRTLRAGSVSVQRINSNAIRCNKADING